MLAALYVRPALRDFVGRDPRRGEQLHQIGAGQLLNRASVGDLMHPAADQQIAGQRPGRGMIDHLIDLELVVTRSGLQEEVVGEILNQIAGGEHVVPVPGLGIGVLD